MPIDIPIVYADPWLLVVNKPAGLLSVPGRGADKSDCASTRVLQHYSDALIVHRLDQATSGLMVLARGVAIQRALNQQFAQRKVRKLYCAQVHGIVTPESGRIDLPIAADWPARPRQKIDTVHGKTALTHYRVLSHSMAHQTSRLALEPITGRTHQLRVHLQAIGHPIVGDALYGPALEFPATSRLWLHAKTLALVHPVTHATMQWEMAEDF
jgi:tRNA pseudouridine32 synthase / 23S rRNA pseudouridine746 synthase